MLEQPDYTFQNADNTVTTHVPSGTLGQYQNSMIIPPRTLTTFWNTMTKLEQHDYTFQNTDKCCDKIITFWNTRIMLEQRNVLCVCVCVCVIIPDYTCQDNDYLLEHQTMLQQPDYTFQNTDKCYDKIITFWNTRIMLEQRNVLCVCVCV